jgi:chromosome segregation ATPase
MNRVAAMVMGAMLSLYAAPSLLAQHGGGHGGGGGGHGAPGVGSVADTSLTDFNRALAVQATPDQTSHFPELTKSTETAKKRAQELSQSGTKVPDSTEFAQRSAALKSAMEEAQGANQDFVKSFTKSQKAGLKELTKKLEKAESEVGKQWKDLEKQLDGVKAVNEGIAGNADKLEKALTEFQSQQIELGKEMGIAPAT